KIRAIRDTAQSRGRDVFINARTDVFLRSLVPDGDAVDETLRRLRLYREAGADGGFVPRLTDLDRLTAITKAAEMPINAMYIPGIADVAALAAAGIARVSLGGALFLASLSLVQRAAGEFLRSGTYAELAGAITVSHAQANGLFAGPRRA
ncbi:MAG TPA: isocitrate lyase/phosphoenolpyruvate mutase family protein, partial [Rhizomicrobium sp.]